MAGAGHGVLWMVWLISVRGGPGVHALQFYDNGGIMVLPYVLSSGKRCFSSCEQGEEEYSWCRTAGGPGASWDYCSAEGKTTRDETCTSSCSLKETLTSSYWWCRTSREDESKWDYCSPPTQVRMVG